MGAEGLWGHLAGRVLAGKTSSRLTLGAEGAWNLNDPVGDAAYRILFSIVNGRPMCYAKEYSTLEICSGLG